MHGSSSSTPPFALGLDIGGTKIAGALVSAEGRIVARATVPTLPERGGEPVFQDAFGLAQDLFAHAARENLQVARIGIGICELVDRAGNIASEQTIKWLGLNIRERFQSLAPTVIEADCRAAALCEARHGAGRNMPIFLYVTVGTGVSCSLMIDGRPYLGARGATGTMATQVLPVLCSECGRISRTALESIASGPGLVALYNRFASASVARAEQVLIAAEANDPSARRAIEIAAETLGGMIGTLINTLDPHAVVIGGGLGSTPGLYWESLKSAVTRHIWSDLQRDTPVLQGTFGADAGVIGAALVAMPAKSNPD